MTFRSPRTAVPAPLLHNLWGAANSSPAETVASAAVTGTYFATVGIHKSEVLGSAKPVGADADSVMNACAGNSAAVQPPAFAADTLAHGNL